MKKNEYFNSNAFFMADIPFNENKIAMHFNMNINFDKKHTLAWISWKLAAIVIKW